uniref:Uncharacterized protein n=1 Tax=Panagrolaimus superbus TaxID=310955 RepID=A0A914YHH4_9BILA
MGTQKFQFVRDSEEEDGEYVGHEFNPERYESDGVPDNLEIYQYFLSFFDQFFQVSDQHDEEVYFEYYDISSEEYEDDEEDDDEYYRNTFTIENI